MKTKHRNAAKFKRDVLREAGPEIFALKIKLAQNLPDADRDKLEMSMTMSIDSICHGRGRTSDFNDLLEGIATCRVLAERMTDEATHDACYSVADAGVVALHGLRDRFLRHGRLGFTAQELQAVRDALDLYVQYLTNCKRGELVDALDAAQSEIKGVNTEQVERKAA